MVVAFIGQTGSNTNNNGSFDITFSYTTGDFIIVSWFGYIVSGEGVATSSFATYTTQTFTKDSTYKLCLNYGKATSTGTSNIHITSSTLPAAVCVMSFSGVYGILPIGDGVSNLGYANALGTSSSVDSPSITPPKPFGMSVMCGGSDTFNLTPGTVTGYTLGALQANTSSLSAQLQMGYKALTTIAAEDPAAYSSWSANNWIAATIVLNSDGISAFDVHEGGVNFNHNNSGHSGFQLW